ncbi:heterokaryon incompatibility protein-domain-containing protein [Pestalotiopsis sp. NC0098]|nr:heterokaryon incompatibility protein-domain-containing protein [Pestalotiopsis sp. NC0098]
MSKFTDGYPLEEIPRTFQEVVQVIKHLKIRYLWIDSYCIIQGDSEDAREDWNREAQKMCSVYTNSYLNIGSAYSKNPHGGLFQQRDVKRYSDVLSIKWRPTAVEEESVYSIRADYEIAWCPTLFSLDRAFCDLRQGAMSERAWTIQEIILSPRMLNFTQSEIIWQCSEGAACETAPAPSRKFILEVEKWSPFWAAENGVAPPSSVENCTDDMLRLIRRWSATLDKYCRADLSYPEKDRLKALAGIGEHFSRLTNRTYQYGVLDGTMPQALLWTSPRSRRTGIGPSWHWAARRNAAYNNLSYGDYEALYNPRGVEILAHTFLQQQDVLSESKVATNAALNINWPTLICVGRLLEPMADSLLNANSFCCHLRLPMDIELLDPSIATYGEIDHGKWIRLQDLRQGDIRILPLLYKDPVIWTMVLRIDESGFYKRIGILEIASPEGKIRAIQKQLAKRKPSLIIIK